jgi:23S rRNA (cytosine1962-C5)-methyltransferase
MGLLGEESAARVIFSEADQLSGLIVDRFASYLVVQPTARAIADRLPEIVAILCETLNPRGVVLRLDEVTRSKEGLEGFAALRSMA